MAFDSLYSCLIIEADAGPSDWRLFEYGRSQPVAGSKQLATRAHTNLPRPADVGLPMGWAAQIVRWRASTSIRLQDPLLDWAAETSAEFRFDDKTVASSPLLDILMAPQPILGNGHRLGRSIGETILTGDPCDGLNMREMIGFGVRVLAPPKDTDQLRAWLVSQHNAARMSLWIWLEGMIVQPIA